MLTLKQFTANGTRYKHYTFGNQGDELVLHRHTYDHLTIVVHGEVTVFDLEKETKLTAPDVIQFEAGRDHGVRAVTPGAVILNVNDASARD